MIDPKDLEYLKLVLAPKNHLHTGADTPRIDYNNLVDRPSHLVFGGDGSDGVIDINSGTTTIDLGNAAVVTKNYFSISVTGTGSLAFSNPHANGTIVILKSKGNVTLTSSATTGAINVKGIGAVGGTGGGPGAGGMVGTTGNFIVDDSAHSGGLGAAGTGTGAAVGGSGGAILSNTTFYTMVANRIFRKALFLACGSGGGGGGGGQGVNGGPGGDGGRGGGCLIIECGGALNFTGKIEASGQDGSGGTDGGTNKAGGGGGGGGAAGMVVILYNQLVVNTGTIYNAGGQGGNGGKRVGGSDSDDGGGGGGAGSYYSAGGAGGNGDSGIGSPAAQNGSAPASLGAGGGGGGGTGAAAGTTGGGAGNIMGGLVIKNTDFA